MARNFPLLYIFTSMTWNSFNEIAGQMNLSSYVWSCTRQMCDYQTLRLWRNNLRPMTCLLLIFRERNIIYDLNSFIFLNADSQCGERKRMRKCWRAADWRWLLNLYSERMACVWTASSPFRVDFFIFLLISCHVDYSRAIMLVRCCNNQNYSFFILFRIFLMTEY